MKKVYRQNGLVVFMLGLAVAIGDAIGWIVVGRALIIIIAIPAVLIPAGLYMIATGTNPFLRLKK